MRSTNIERQHEAERTAKSLLPYFQSCQAEGRRTDAGFSLRTLHLLTQLLPNMHPDTEQHIRSTLSMQTDTPVEDGIQAVIQQSLQKPGLRYMYAEPALRCLCAILESAAHLSEEQIQTIEAELWAMNEHRSQYPHGRTD